LRDGKQKTVEASIGAMPRNLASEEHEAAQPGGGKTANALGMKLLPLDLQLRRELKVRSGVNGVVVGQVAGDSPGSSPPPATFDQVKSR
jgi:hypothetical protein